MNTKNILLKTGRSGHVREGCGMVEPCSALSRTGHTQHCTSSVPLRSLYLAFSCVLKSIFSNILCFFVLGILARHNSAPLMVTGVVYWTEPVLVLGVIELDYSNLVGFFRK